VVGHDVVNFCGLDGIDNLAVSEGISGQDDDLDGIEQPRREAMIGIVADLASPDSSRASMAIGTEAADAFPMCLMSR
jgi:hypothetical protein